MYEIPDRRLQEEKKPKIIPFKVHFGHKILSGKSYVRNGIPQGIPYTVTEKFYIKDRYNLDPEKIQVESEKLKVLGPKEKYNEHVTENQRYGWYQHVKFTNLNKTDNRVHFAKHMDHLIKLYLQTMDKKK